jgi:hypothetical protein
MTSNVEAITPMVAFMGLIISRHMQRRVPSNRKDAGDRLRVPTCRMRRQDAVASLHYFITS